MKILFYPVACASFDEKTLDERPLGGTETAIIYLADALAKLGHDVFVVTKEKNSSSAKPRYIHESEIKGEYDLLIVIRDWKRLLSSINAKKRFYWTGDAFNSLNTIGIGDRRFSGYVDGMLCVSNWHKKSLCATSGFPEQKAFVLRNGINLADFDLKEQRQRKRLIYTSMPLRGLIHLPPIYEALKKKHSDLELHIFSSANRYRLPHEEGNEFMKESEILEKCRLLPGCHVHGSVIQKELAKELMRSSVLVYPCDFEESSCIAIMEAQAAGCPVVTTDIAAIKETVGEGGVAIKGHPDSQEYQQQFVDVVDHILSDDSYFQKLSQIARGQAMSYDWSLRAKMLLTFLASEHDLR